MLYRAYIEVRQVKLQGKDYFRLINLEKVCVLISILLNSAVIVGQWIERKTVYQKEVSAIGAILMWIQLFMWLPVAEATADIWQMIIQTV